MWATRRAMWWSRLGGRAVGVEGGLGCGKLMRALGRGGDELRNWEIHTMMPLRSMRVEDGSRG